MKVLNDAIMLLPWHILIHRYTSTVTKLNSLKWPKRQCFRAIHAFKTTNLSLLREIITNKSLVLFSECKCRH